MCSAVGPGCEADLLSPAGEMQAFWPLTGRGSDRNETETAGRRRRKSIGRLSRFVLHPLGYRRRVR